MTKPFKGKIIYNPSGKAGEYSKWAANFYNGCSNRCDYCYNRHCLAKDVLGKDEPTLKKALGTTKQAIEIFNKELLQNRDQIILDGGLFFNFVSDPCLPETWDLNWQCMKFAMEHMVPCTLLTKRAEVLTYLAHCAETVSSGIFPKYYYKIDGDDINLCRHYLKIGFTLTGMDELEPGASTNTERCEAMKIIHSNGIRTWASIEPVIDLGKSAARIFITAHYCDEYKIGLLSGKKSYSPQEVTEWKSEIDDYLQQYNKKVLWKDSVLSYIAKAHSKAAGTTPPAATSSCTTKQ